MSFIVGDFGILSGDTSVDCCVKAKPGAPPKEPLGLSVCVAQRLESGMQPIGYRYPRKLGSALQRNFVSLLQ